MIDILISLFQILIAVLGLFLIILVLLQRGRGGGLAGAFGGAGGQSAFGTKAGDVFTRVTVFVAMIWIILCGVQGYCMRQTKDRFANTLSNGEDKTDDKETKDGDAPKDKGSQGSKLPFPGDGEKQDDQGEKLKMPEAGGGIDTPMEPGKDTPKPEAPEKEASEKEAPEKTDKEEAPAKATTGGEAKDNPSVKPPETSSPEAKKGTPSTESAEKTVPPGSTKPATPSPANPAKK